MSKNNYEGSKSNQSGEDENDKNRDNGKRMRTRSLENPSTNKENRGRKKCQRNEEIQRRKNIHRDVHKMLEEVLEKHGIKKKKISKEDMVLKEDVETGVVEEDVEAEEEIGMEDVVVDTVEQALLFKCFLHVFI
ncbi:uncharacterized protein LOC122501845 [Leptopilina heterotoma]|uniref:uncharacterized protein LOC122501845 n=1 Tax=Leptopilina heterotoma TaxID=63436 RepID=UPI001CA8B82C|nr:uncharacterized protein LOC122501845 [Leptopilina heterotoma]